MTNAERYSSGCALSDLFIGHLKFYKFQTSIFIFINLEIINFMPFRILNDLLSL